MAFPRAERGRSCRSRAFSNPPALNSSGRRLTGRGFVLSCPADPPNEIAFETMAQASILGLNKTGIILYVCRGKHARVSERDQIGDFSRGVFSMRKIVPKVPVPGDNPKASLSGSDAARFFGPPPLFVGEDPTQYEAMRDQISRAVGPLDFLEEIWVNDVIDLVWEAQRLRRLKAALLQARMHQSVETVLKPLMGKYGYSEAQDLAREWATREKKAIKEVALHLEQAGLTMETVKAETLASNLDDFERIDRLIASAEARRDASLREIDRHRFGLGAALRQAADEIEDAEFTEIPPAETEGQSA